MKVILRQDILGLGRKGEVKEVSSGHARNFLLPRGLAEAATDRSLAELKRRQVEQQLAIAAESENLRRLAAAIDGLTLQFKLRTDKKTGSVFGSVGREEIIGELKARGYDVPEKITVSPARPIKELGEQQIKLTLKAGAEATVRVQVQPQT